jgi:hypothetical protein
VVGALETSTPYARGQEKFQEFAELHGVSEPFLEPITPMMLLGFMVWVVHVQSLAVSTAVRWKTAVRSLCVDLGTDITSFSSPLVRRALRGLKKAFPAARRPPKLPITTALLYQFLCVAHITTPLEMTLFAVACVGVYGMFRASDLVYRGPDYVLLLRSDVAWVGRDARILLRGSKHDYFHRGEYVRLYHTRFRTSPVLWLKAAFRLAPDKAPGAPLFQNPDGSPITYYQLQAFLKRLATAIGVLEAGVTTRSLRIGGATTLAALRVPVYTLKAMGRWKSVSYQPVGRRVDAPDVLRLGPLWRRPLRRRRAFRPPANRPSMPLDD